MQKVLFFIFFLVFSVGAYSQTDSLSVKKDKSSIVQKKFETNTLEKYKADKDFDYSENTVAKEPTLIERLFNWLSRQLLRFFEWIFGVKYAKGILGTILKVIPYILVGILLFLLIKFFLKVNTSSIVSSASNKAIVSITSDEELIKNKDLPKLIKQAIELKNYRLAVRYYYLNSIKQLEHNKLISWEQQKTNEDYIQEISRETIKSAFTNLTRLYDFVWYGNFEINENEFEKIAANFEAINNLINSK
ncbi:DUF4129 domain-containing protein [Lutibacter sp. A80]|uniref:DUF4129 domain-containing protein n=1 Tax=Lutibacter sp. A80 TaxID=2918453 RepID=UPI001F06D626|nr:DUF4129 domain-containing protein [Lutibacter sp. A80]UMB61578.1 DUF4129 domain-containing protein [Lutibacter sp. A80]